MFQMVRLQEDRVSLRMMWRTVALHSPPVDLVWVRSKPLLCCGTEFGGCLLLHQNSLIVTNTSFNFTEPVYSSITCGKNLPAFILGGPLCSASLTSSHLLESRCASHTAPSMQISTTPRGNMEPQDRRNLDLNDCQSQLLQQPELASLLRKSKIYSHLI